MFPELKEDHYTIVTYDNLESEFSIHPCRACLPDRQEWGYYFTLATTFAPALLDKRMIRKTSP